MRVKVIVEVFWARVEVINNILLFFSGTEAERPYCGVFSVALLKQFYMLMCVWTGVLRCDSINSGNFP